MSNKTKYKQCDLVNSNLIEISWIPTEYAKVGKVLELKNEDGTWESGWVVEKVYDEIVREVEDIDANRNTMKHMNAVTGKK